MTGDSGHHSYAGFGPVALMQWHIGRISFMHFEDIDPMVKTRAIENRTGFYDACGQDIFCNLGGGDVDFPAVRRVLRATGIAGWCTVEQDRDPTRPAMRAGSGTTPTPSVSSEEARTWRN